VLFLLAATAYLFWGLPRHAPPGPVQVVFEPDDAAVKAAEPVPHDSRPQSSEPARESRGSAGK